MLEYDNKYSNLQYVCGVDEAGAGPLAGPVVAAAVVLDWGFAVAGIGDSKKLSEKKRLLLEPKIKESAVDYKISIISHNIIDEINILQARLLAMKNAVLSLAVEPQICLIDGNYLLDITLKSEAVIKGDSLSQAIAAASILAKNERDRIMVEYDALYPQYGFKQHKGYPTKAHIEAIKRYGLSEIHRRSFCKKILEV